MHIGLTGFGLGQGKTGLATYVFHLWKALGEIDRSNQYELMIPSSSKQWMPKLPPNFQTCTSSAVLEQPLLNILWHNSVLPIRTLSHRYQLIHIPTFRRIPLIKSCPVVATIHDLAGIAVKNKYGPLRSFYHKNLLSQLIHRCDRVITVSQATKQDILTYTSYPEHKIEVIYSGIDTTIFHPVDLVEAQAHLQMAYSFSRPFIVYVSRIEHPGKNHVRLIEAFEKLRQQLDVPYSLIFAGADWQGASAVKKRAAESAYRKDIHFLGFVPTGTIVNLYSTCDLMIFPSLYEGFGFPLLEAMACGALTACSNSSSLAELGKGYAELFDPWDSQEIYLTMARVLAAPDKEDRRERAQSYANSFVWSRTARQVLTVYQQIVG